MKGSADMNNFAGKAVKALALSALTALMLSATALAADGEIAVGAGVTTGDRLRLRSEPGTDSSVITTLDEGLAVAVLDEGAGGWYRIAYNGKTGYVSADYLLIDQDNVFETYGRVSGDGVNVRTAPSTDSEVVVNLSAGKGVTVRGLEDGWYLVTYNDDGGEGYIRSDFLDLTNTEPGSASSFGGAIVDTAKQYIGVRYVYGGASPSGFDCSGFTMYVYRQFGINLPHSATSQWQSGMGQRIYSVGELQPGDLVFFNDPARNNGKACSHAGIYVGGGQFIHACSNHNVGIIISDITTGSYARYYVGGLRIG